MCFDAGGNAGAASTAQPSFTAPAAQPKPIMTVPSEPPAPAASDPAPVFAPASAPAQAKPASTADAVRAYAPPRFVGPSGSGRVVN